MQNTFQKEMVGGGGGGHNIRNTVCGNYRAIGLLKSGFKLNHASEVTVCQDGECEDGCLLGCYAM
jgi:hypothetical protein